MMALVLGILGSPRRGGNTDLLLDAALDGAKRSGADVQKIILDDLDIKGCTACGECESGEGCPIEDDMASLYPLLEQADAIILASPVYFDGLTSQMKAFIDRGQLFWVNKYILKQAGKKKLGAFLTTAARIRTDFSCAERTVKTFFLALDAENFRTLAYAGFEEKGSIADHPSALCDASKLGEDMVTSLRSR